MYLLIPAHYSFSVFRFRSVSGHSLVSRCTPQVLMNTMGLTVLCKQNKRSG